MAGDAVERHLLPGDSLQIFDGADDGTLALQNRPLLDVQFDIGRGAEEAGLGGAGLADAGEFVAEHAAVDSDRR